MEGIAIEPQYRRLFLSEHQHGLEGCRDSVVPEVQHKGSVSGSDVPSDDPICDLVINIVSLHAKHPPDILCSRQLCQRVHFLLFRIRPQEMITPLAVVIGRIYQFTTLRPKGLIQCLILIPTILQKTLSLPVKHIQVGISALCLSGSHIGIPLSVTDAKTLLY